MKIRTISKFFSCLLFFVAGSTAFAQMPDGPGKDVLYQVCGKCHDAEIVKGYHQDSPTWSHTISQMIDQGAEGTDDQFNAILAYLNKNFGTVTPIKVNTATAAELQTQLEVTAKEAEAIVKYRTDKGPFKEAGDLKSVPDLDYKKIEAKKDRLAFQ